MARRKNKKRIDPRYFLHETTHRDLNEDEQEIDLEGIINNALKQAELPLSAEDIKAFYHATPSDRIFLVPADDKYAAMGPAYRPKRNPNKPGEWDFPDPRPLMPNIDAKKVGLDDRSLVGAMSKSGLANWSKEQYVGPPYSNVRIPTGWEYNPEWGWTRGGGDEWEVEP